MIVGLLYNFIIELYGLGIRIAAFSNPKAKKWIIGRKNQDLSQLKAHKGALWFHCASVGEFEQARPLIELVRSETKHKIVLSFYSPSGYELRKDYDKVDAVFYLPLDRKNSMKRLFKSMEPSILILVKYELWQNLLIRAKESATPVMLISARFGQGHFVFGSFARRTRGLLSKIDLICTQDAMSKALLQERGFKNVIVAGDTRFDRVIEISKQKKVLDYGEKSKRKLIIAGSTWKEDEVFLLTAMSKLKKDFQLIIVPHEISRNDYNKDLNLKNISLGIHSQGCLLDEDLDVLIYDKLGMLSHLYRDADIAYIGGGFGSGIHNILEPAVFGIPVLFGPKNARFLEAQEMKARGGGLEISGEADLIRNLKVLLDEHKLKELGKLSKDYVHSSEGASQLCFDHMIRLLKGK